MQIYYNIEKLESDTAITLGTFDGLHIGHVKIIKQLVEDAKKRKLKSVVYTFANNPSTITNDDDKPSTILEMKCKKRIIEELGVDILILLNFDEKQKNISPDSFIRNILIENLKMKHLVVGYDFQFGKKAQGNIELLIQESKKFNYTYDIVEPIKKDFVRISSTLIRKLLKNGNIEDANYYLGRNYSLEGIVIDGEKIGRKIGFPTANLELDNNFAILKPGVYITRTIIDNKKYYSITNVGFNPTLKQSDFTVETHILDFNESIYGKIIRVDFYKRIRNEMKFSSINDLKESIRWDIYTTRKYFDIL
ncbi:bifunctional riboflavin kinase/FAD synthetase [Clostridiaceae bacterium HSG29]|nr:bifunctional riboflavin kinase/FAD synthetase [Clostridiaceae bacterium HSG29]